MYLSHYDLKEKPFKIQGQPCKKLFCRSGNQPIKNPDLRNGIRESQKIELDSRRKNAESSG